MKIEFSSRDYIEFQTNNDKYYIIISAKDPNNLNNAIINSVELNLNQLIDLLKSINLTMEKNYEK